MNGSQRRALVSGFIFIVLGVVFLLESLEVFTLAPSTLWPVLLISLGFAVLAGIGGDDGEGDG